MKTKRIITMLFFGWFVYLTATATDNLRLPDLRTLSLGGGGVTETPLFNPALLALQKRNKLYANYYNRYSVSELATVSGGFYCLNDILPAGFEITSFGYDEYRESLFRLSTGKRIAHKWSLGIALQYALLQSALFEESSGRVSADVGITYRPVENVLTGLSILHFPSVKTGDKNIDNKHIASYSVQLGFNWDIMNMALITGSLENSEENVITGSFGMEYIPFDDFKIRTGIRTAPLRPSLGVGYCIAGIDADVGMMYHSILGVSMGVGLSFSF
ncbi:MAG: hypothetical protein LBC47_06680 [Tannerella sp.]|jgi:hypothetical protein|nr:hypothetical protein [Tannerella sp.]